MAGEVHPLTAIHWVRNNRGRGWREIAADQLVTFQLVDQGYEKRSRARAQLARLGARSQPQAAAETRAQATQHLGRGVLRARLIEVRGSPNASGRTEGSFACWGSNWFFVQPRYKKRWREAPLCCAGTYSLRAAIEDLNPADCTRSPLQQIHSSQSPMARFVRHLSRGAD
jgi:hypothetical protein